MSQKLVVVIMGQNCEKFIGMCLDSVKSADAIVYCDGGSTDKTREIVAEFIRNKNGMMILNDYNQEDKGMNGKQRNFYLKYLKKNYPDYWCLVLDADEVVYDLNEIKKFIQVMPQGVYSPKMRHLIGNLGYEDSIKPEHFVLHRLFHISMADRYPEKEHPILIPKQGNKVIPYGGTDCTTIWHLAYIPGMFDIKKRYDNHLKKSQIHSKEYLRDWYYKHLFGTYPISKVNSIELPKPLLNYFGVDVDEVYFATHRKIELKHFLMMQQWCEHFKPTSILDLGCGIGMYGFVSKAFGIPYLGIEISEYAVKTNPYRIEKIQGDITKDLEHKNAGDLVLVLDVLEHIKYEDLDKTLKNISKCGKHFIFSLPYLGDPNLNADPTHIIKETKDWWINRLSEYFDLNLEKQDWMYEHQTLVGKPK